METTDQGQGSDSCNCSLCNDLMDSISTPTLSAERHESTPPLRAGGRDKDPSLTPALPPSPPPSPSASPDSICDPPLEQAGEEQQGRPSTPPLMNQEARDCGEGPCEVETQEPGQLTDPPSSLGDDQLQADDQDPTPGVTKSTSRNSIYFDDGTAKIERSKPEPTVPRRLTLAERARLEALASFGGKGLGAMRVRKIDLHTELKRKAEEDKEMEGKGGPPAKRSRLQAAKEEVASTFKDVALGEGRRRYGKSGPPTLHRKRTTGARTSRSQRLRPSRVELAQKAAMETFGEASLDDLPVKKRPVMSTDGSATAPQASGRRLTRVERARLEAMESFGGTNHDAVMENSTKKVARCLEGKKAGEEGESEQKENVSSC